MHVYYSELNIYIYIYIYPITSKYTIGYYLLYVYILYLNVTVEMSAKHGNVYWATVHVCCVSTYQYHTPLNFNIIMVYVYIAICV